MGARLRILLTNFQIHESEMIRLQSALAKECKSSNTYAILKRQWDEHDYIARRYARLIVEAEEEKQKSNKNYS